MIAPGRIIGEAHVEQPPGRRVGRRGGRDHPLQQRPELDQGELIGHREGAAFGAQQRREHQPLAVQVVMLARPFDQLGRHHPRLDPEPLLQPPPSGSAIASGSPSAPARVSAASSR